MNKIAFHVSARAAKLLGRDNFSNASGAIMELVKNSYDADASNCLIVFDVQENSENSSIYIIDNGEGMILDTIENHWMKIGTSNKDNHSVSEGKRVKTGAKGIGRFALDRLGTETEMWTFSNGKKNKEGLYWKMDWSQFDNTDKPISEIEASVESYKIKQDEIIKNLFIKNKSVYNLLSKLKFDYGTVLKISHLKDDWSDSDIDELFRDLETMVPPEEFSTAFDINLQYLQKPSEYGDVCTAFFNDFDYKVSAKYDSEKLEVAFEVTRNELDLDLVNSKFKFLYKDKKAPFDLKTLNRKTFKYKKTIFQVLGLVKSEESTKALIKVGSFDFTYFFLKEIVSKKEGYPYKSIVTAERRAILKRFGGIKIYRDNFSVRPYGYPENDWLSLGLRASASPAGPGQRIGDWRVRREHIAGVISISRNINELLEDKSDRIGLKENNTVTIFKNIVTEMLHEFELDRSKILNSYYLNFKEAKKVDAEKKIEAKASEMAKKASSRKNYKSDGDRESDELEYKSAFTEVLKENLEKDREEIVQVRSLASLGLIFASFTHELKDLRNNTSDINFLEKIYKEVVSISAQKTKKFKQGLDIINAVKNGNLKINHWINYSLTAIKRDRRTASEINFSDYMSSLSKNWHSLLDDRNISLEIKDNVSSTKHSLKGFSMDLDTIFANLITNSIDSFNSSKLIIDRKIVIDLDLINEEVVVLYSDNGPGLSEIFANNREKIFLPLVTSKKDRLGNSVGTGLGMYLVKEVIDDNYASIKILELGEGFSVKMVFPVKINKK